MKFTFFILLFVITIEAFAQNRKIDSVNNLIAKAATDTARINLLNAKANIYTRNSLDSALTIALATIKQAKRIAYIKGEADANMIVASSYTLKGLFVLSKSYITAAETLYKQTADSAGINSVYRTYGMYYGMQSKYDSSLVFFKLNVAYNERNGNKKELTSAYQNIAVSYTMLSNYQQSIYYQNKALQLAESTNDITNLAYITLNMAISYSNVSDYAKTEQLNLKAIQYAKQAQIKNVELYGYANVAAIYRVLNKNTQAYEYAMKAVNLGKQLGDYAIVASSMSRAGTALAAQKKFAEAEPLNAKAIQIADSIGAPLNIYQTYADMGYLRKEQQRYPEAITYYEKGFASLKDADIYDTQIGGSYSDLAEVYEKSGSFQKALTAFKTASKISDSIRSRENIRRSTEQSMNYDFDKKQQAQQAETQKQDTVNKIKQIFLIAFLLVFITLSIVALSAYKNKQKANALLGEQKEEIAAQRDNLEETLAELKITQAQLIQSEKMASLGELTAGIAHEIQNPLNFVNNFSEVSNELIEELKAERLKPKAERDEQLEDELLQDVSQNLEKINHHGKRADSIVKGMLQHSRRSNGQKELTDINALADEYLRLSYHGLRAKDKSFNATMQTNFDELLPKIKIIPQDIGRVLLNLFTNAFYATNEKQKAESAKQNTNYKPTVTVTTRSLSSGEGKGEVEIVVKDNGSGIPQHVVDKIFQPFFTTKPTGEGTGLGLSLSYEIIKTHGGEIKVETKEGEGSLFKIILPLKT